MKIQTRSLIIVTVLSTIAFFGCLRDPYGDNSVMTPEIPGWKITSTEHNLGSNLRRLLFVTPEKGYLIGYNGYLMHTADSGKTWTAQDAGTDLHLGNICFVDENVGFISGRGSDDCLNEDCGKGSFLLRTVNGGVTWDKVFYDTLAYLESMVWNDASHGLGVMEYRVSPESTARQLVRTNDAGDTWVPLDQAVSGTFAPSLAGFGDILYLTAGGTVIKSTDFGTTWQTLTTPSLMTGGWYHLWFFNSNLGFISDNSGVYRTANGGQTWQRTDSDMAYFDAVHFYNALEGFCFNVLMQYQGGDWPVVVGSYVYSTTDGGESWFKSGLYRNFYAGTVSYPADEIGYGINGTYFHKFSRK